MLFIFQLTNIILSRVQGPEAVTQYNIAYKYFNVLNMAANIILTPFWSAFTDAYIKRDYNWMRGTLEKLEKLWLLCIPILVLMVLSSDLLYKFWIGDSVAVSFSLSFVWQYMYYVRREEICICFLLMERAKYVCN